MRTRAWLTMSLIALLSVLSVVVYRRYQIQPLPAYPFEPVTKRHKRVLTANNLFCKDWAQRPVSRIVIIELVPQPNDTRPLIMINEDETETWSKAQEVLKSIYSTRSHRVLFLVDNPDVEHRYRTELMDMLRQSSFIEDVCVIDPKNPPSWYPLPNMRMPSRAAR